MRAFEAILSLLLLNLYLSFLPPSLAISSGAEGYTINGRAKIEAKGFGLPGKISNVQIILNGGQRVTFLRPDGYFSFHNVPAGTHLIEVAAIGYFFSPVRVDVSARNPGKVQAALTENRRGLSELVLEPLREEYYYEIREPFSIMSLLKSPMGLMVGFMVIVVFLMPKLMENMGTVLITWFNDFLFQHMLSDSDLVHLLWGDRQAYSLIRFWPKPSHASLRHCFALSQWDQQWVQLTLHWGHSVPIIPCQCHTHGARAAGVETPTFKSIGPT